MVVFSLMSSVIPVSKYINSNGTRSSSIYRDFKKVKILPRNVIIEVPKTHVF